MVDCSVVVKPVVDVDGGVVVPLWKISYFVFRYVEKFLSGVKKFYMELIKAKWRTYQTKVFGTKRDHHASPSDRSTILPSRLCSE